MKKKPTKQTIIHLWALQDGLFFPSASVDALMWQCCQKQQSHLLPHPDTLVPTTVGCSSRCWFDWGVTTSVASSQGGRIASLGGDAGLKFCLNYDLSYTLTS